MELVRASVAVVALFPFLCGVATAHPTARSIARSTILDRADDLLPEYDYIIIGGGTAGLTVADRLTENERRKNPHFLSQHRPPDRHKRGGKVLCCKKKKNQKGTIICLLVCRFYSCPRKGPFP